MPLPILWLLTFAAGLVSAWAGRSEIRVTPRPLYYSTAFLAYAGYLLLGLLPVSLYLYLMHGDWAVLYVVDTNRVPSAVSLIVFLLQIAVGAGGFLLACQLFRTQRSEWVVVALGATVALAVLLVGLGHRRLGVVGSYDQFWGGFGLTGYGHTPLLPSGIIMAVWLSLGLGYLSFQLLSFGRASN